MTSSGPFLTRRGLLGLGGLAAGSSVVLGLPGLRTSATTAGASGTARGPGPYFPPAAGDWEVTTAAAAGWDAPALDRALAFAGSRASTGVVILHRGRLLAERYWHGADAGRGRDVASVQKSVLSLLAGVVARDGRLGLDDRVSRWLGRGWSAADPLREARVTVRHLLTMTSGLDDQLAVVAPPGTRWYYNTVAYGRLAGVLEAAAGEPVPQLARRLLFAPVGIGSDDWVPRPRPDGTAPLGLVLTPRDLARFGLLTLAGGRWDRRPVVDRRHVAAATSTSQPLNLSYGLLWWLNGRASHLVPGSDPQVVEGPLVPNAPADLVAALGKDDQKVYVVPSLDLVVVRQGRRAGPPRLAPSGFDNQWWALLRRAAPH